MAISLNISCQREANLACHGKFPAVGVRLLCLDPTHSAVCMVKHPRVHNATVPIGNSFSMALGTSYAASGWILRGKINATNSTGLVFAEPFLQRKVILVYVVHLSQSTKSFYGLVYTFFINQKKRFVPMEDVCEGEAKFTILGSGIKAAFRW